MRLLIPWISSFAIIYFVRGSMGYWFLLCLFEISIMSFMLIIFLQKINRNSNESADKFNDNISNHKKPILKYILIVLFTFFIGAVVVFAFLFIINKNIDVSIIPHETDKIKIPDIIENKLSENIHKAKNLYKCFKDKDKQQNTCAR